MEPAPDEFRQIDLVKIYGSKKCLVVDDFPDFRGSLSRSLRKFGVVALDTAADGEETVRLCSKNRYDLIICDYNLGPGKDGQQVLEELRQGDTLPMTSLFVILTGETSRQMVLGALEYQPDDYLTKPYTEDSLRTRLNRALIRHQALLPIKASLAKGEYEQALAGCNSMLSGRSRYSQDCLKIKGQILIRLNRLAEAEQLYATVLANKPLVWAKLGMAKTLILLRKDDAAESLLLSILQEDSRYIEAHDLLVELYQAQQDPSRAQQAAEVAAQVSPKSVQRQRRLAELAELNGDDAVAVKGHLGAIRWGGNSCYESPQDYLNFVRKTADLVRDQPNAPENAARVKQAALYLERARKRYSREADVDAQTLMVEAQLHHCQNKPQQAELALNQARKLYQQLERPTLEASLQLARGYQTLGLEEQARELLSELANQNPDNQPLLHAIDRVGGEPLSKAGKEVAARLTRTGINAYEQKEFEQAIDVFLKAITIYPRHIGLNLNLIQAIIAAVDAGCVADDFQQHCSRCLRAIGEIRPDHKQYPRLNFLKKQLNRLYPASSPVR